MPRSSYYSAEAVRAIPEDGKRYETVHGELLVTPAPGGRHQFVLGRLQYALETYLRVQGIADLLVSPADISFADDSLVQPDLFVADLRQFRQSWHWSEIRTLYLAVEILSPPSVRADRFTKRRLYQEQGVATYWIVDIDQRLVEVWTPGAHFPTLERERLEWRHPQIAGVCAVELTPLFAGG